MSFLDDMRAKTKALKHSLAPIVETQREVLQRLLELGMVQLRLDTHAPGLAGIPWAKLTEPYTTINISYHFPAPALDIDDDGIDVSLNFSWTETDGSSKTTFERVHIPLASIVSAVSPLSGEGFHFHQPKPEPPSAA